MRISMKQIMMAAVVAATVFGGVCTPAQAADLGPGYRSGGHVRTVWRDSWRRWTWRDRCAYAGHYCLYAWDGYIYHYPYDDRPSHRRYRYRG